MVEMDGRPAAELQGLLEFFAVHRRAADRGEAVGRAVEVDVARDNPRIVVRERVPWGRVHRVAQICGDQQRKRRFRRKRLVCGDRRAQVAVKHLHKRVGPGIVAVRARLHDRVDGDRLLVERCGVGSLVGAVEAVSRPEDARQRLQGDVAIRESPLGMPRLERLHDRHA